MKNEKNKEKGEKMSERERDPITRISSRLNPDPTQKKTGKGG